MSKMNSTKRGVPYSTEYCDHCHGKIKNHHEAWHRKGRHYCCNACYRDDQTGCPPSIKPIDRK